MIFNREIETAKREDLKKIQLKRLQETIARCYNKIPLYKKKLDAVGITPEKVTSLDILKDIPFTTKDDLRENYPYGMFAEPMNKIVRIHASSGTTGKPTVVGYTKDDLDMWAECVARLVVAAGATADDIAQISFGYGLFTGAFGLHYGLEKMGATVIPMSSGNTEKQIMIMKDFGSTILVGTPSYALHMSEVAKEMGVKKEDIKLRIGLFGAEASTEEMRCELENNWGILATENYGLSEIIGPGVAGECFHKCGMHINEDFFIPEVINPETGETLKNGEKGELVFTTIGKQGLPILRYRTRDLSYLIEEPCACGRTSYRINKITGRSDDMLIIKGVNVFPSQIESVLVGMEHISPNYQILLNRIGHFDNIEVVVELIDGQLLERYRELEALEKLIKHRLYSVTGLDIKIKLVSPKTIERSQGKAKRVVDMRGK